MRGNHFHINPVVRQQTDLPAVVPPGFQPPVVLGGREMRPPALATGGTPQPSMPTNHPWYSHPGAPSGSYVAPQSIPIVLPQMEYSVEGSVE